MNNYERLASALAPLYTLEEELGRGALGTVYLATAADGRRAAVKVLAQDLVALMREPDAFVATLERAGRVSHAGLLPMYGAGTTAEGDLYYAMAYVESGSARDRFEREGVLAASEVAAVGAAACDALAAAHAEGIVHGTIAPSNLYLEGDRVRVADLGVHAALLAAGIEPGRIVTLMGAPQYMSPEQLAGAPLDARSDVYALGTTLYELLTGKPPFGGRTTSYVIASVLAGEPNEPEGDVVTGLVTDTVLRSIEKAPEDRWPSAAAYARALRANREGTPISSPVVEPAPKAVARRGCATVLAIATAGLGAGALGVLAVLR